MHTPWGPSENTATIARGVTEAITVRHGGIHLIPALNAVVDQVWRHSSGWYERDCDWAIVALTFPSLFSEDRVQEAHQTAKRWHAEMYAKLFPQAEPEPQAGIDLDALSAAVNEILAGQPDEVEDVDAEQLAAMMERAKKLLTMAERGSTQGERDAFADKAAALMAKYGISAAMMDSGSKTPGRVGDWLVTVNAPYCYDKASLLAAMVAAYSGQIIYTDKNTHASTLRVYATAADLERMKVLWPSLLTQMTTELGWATVAKPDGVRADVFGRSFIHGFVGVVRDRLTAAERYAEREAQEERDAAGTGGTSVALVLAGRKDEVERAFKKAHPNRSASRRRLTSSAAGVTAGQTAGRRASLGQGRVGA